MRWVVVLLVVGACSHHATHAVSEVPMRADHVEVDETKEWSDGTYSVPGLDALDHKPIVMLDDVSAWHGTPETLPQLTVYEDGKAIVVYPETTGARIEEGTVADPRGLARRIGHDLSALDPRITTRKRATDQPETTVFVRAGTLWRAVTVVGFRGNGAIVRESEAPPAEFVTAYEELADIAPKDAHPFAWSDFVVTLRDDGVPSHPPEAWPADVPAPPSDLVPDERWIGRPRSYDLHGDSGASLLRFSRRLQGYGATTPSGERVSLEVHVAIPSNAYVEKVRACKSWKRIPAHECDR
jgi:hypothetical protein